MDTVKEDSDHQFLKFLKGHQLIQGQKPSKNKQKQQKQKDSEFLKQINTFTNYHDGNKVKYSMNKASIVFAEDLKVKEKNAEEKEEEFNAQSIQNQFQKTNREQELKQQKKILMLHQRIFQMTKDIQEIYKKNREIYSECKEQQTQVNSFKREKYEFEKNKLKWDQKLLLMRQQYDQNDQLIKQLKPLVNYQTEELEERAYILAKKELKSSQDYQPIGNNNNMLRSQKNIPGKILNKPKQSTNAVEIATIGKTQQQTTQQKASEKQSQAKKILEKQPSLKQEGEKKKLNNALKLFQKK